MSNIAELLQTNQTLSYEFSPPKTEAQAAALRTAVDELAATEPDFISITYGAMGSTREATKDFAIRQNVLRSFPAMPHLTCVGQRPEKIKDLLVEYAGEGVENILALRGDGDEPGAFVHAIGLATFIKDCFPWMSVGVAAHPEVHPASASRESDRQHLAAKLEVADFAITQFFFDPNDYHRLIDELDDLGCNKPIIPGIMLFGSAGGLARMAALNNATIPEKLANRLERTAPADMGKLALDTAL
ncbi:MAG TPA: methylenetetrahydrofolate reductase, partial [Patescibacteria group bacterium]|nr:methylenetetrahydrofolate reductase [Patescibacteria group bacterium]